MEDFSGNKGTRENQLIFFMEKYGDALLRICSVYLRDSALAEDAVQETFVKVYKTFEGFRGECSEKTWLMRIAINTCKDIRRSAWYRYVDRRVTLDSIPVPSCPPAPEQTRLAIEIMKLPPKYMEVVLLYYYQGMTMIEIGKVLGIPNQTVSSRLTIARNKLRLNLEGGRTDEPIPL